MIRITELPVERNEDGYWTHPKYAEFCAGRESIPTSEFDEWMHANGLNWGVSYLETDSAAEAVKDRYFETGNPDVSEWKPTHPDGDGWFVGSIHDTEDGPVCIWLRNNG
ncbi:hypothetical protein [Pectobacterium odoriferum]|uniref:hypothetical protein n=1 Tax=Pectobacterium odoriferum TaxID=78398 RepID=UPI001CF50EA8|nr:hypothetical protein [Pectobacterium odoriferum]MCA6962459.1 hypothetical protein [Pectobacterium odoriferum]MCH5010555.1 hypothetical protein [Pectobacterium odoriferum]